MCIVHIGFINISLFDYYYSCGQRATGRMAEVAIDLAEWMTQLPDQLKHIPIIYLAIPGKN